MNEPGSPLAPLLVIAAVALGGCAATTTAQLEPSPQPPMCQSSANALVLWAPQWRPDQKDAPEREAAAADGIGQFFAQSGCFASASVQQGPQPFAAAVTTALEQARSHYDRLVVVTVRELGPIVKIGSSSALIEGGTEVVLVLAEYRPPDWSARRSFSVQWRNGGPGVIKGVASLPRDIQAALAVGMQPGAK